jgi:cyclopropane fatty-acyl-phospholipid synthase-like methyltransferase
MLEAVGKEYIEPYFKMIDEVLNESGVAVFQVITIPESRFENCEFSWGRSSRLVGVSRSADDDNLAGQIRTMRISSRSGGEHDEIEM